jgi:hypothetical protein
MAVADLVSHVGLVGKLAVVVDVVIEHEAEFPDALQSRGEAGEGLEVDALCGVVRRADLSGTGTQHLLGELRFLQERFEWCSQPCHCATSGNRWLGL